MRMPLEACREPTGSYNRLPEVYTYFLTHAPYTCIVQFWHISNMPPLDFCIAALFVKYWSAIANGLL